MGRMIDAPDDQALVAAPLVQDRPSPICPISPESLAGDMSLDDDCTQLFDGSPAYSFATGSVTWPQDLRQGRGHSSDPPFVFPRTPDHDDDALTTRLDGPTWTADCPITIHGQEYSSLTDHLKDLEANMTFLNKYRSPESLKYDYTASPPYVPEDMFTPGNLDDDDLDSSISGWSYGDRWDKACTDSPPYVPIDYNTLGDPDDDKYYVMSPDYSYVSLEEDDIPPLALSPPSREFGCSPYNHRQCPPTPAFTASP